MQSFCLPSGSPAAAVRLQPWIAPAIELLRTLSTPAGIHASQSETANYRAVFTRDAVMAGIAGLLLGDEEVIAGFVHTLERLREIQGRAGQIASNYALRPDSPPEVSFGTVVPRIDSATWYLVGVALAARSGVIDAAAWEASAGAVVRLLDALEYNGRDLIYVPAGGNWADEYLTEGYILYDQVLRAWALRLLGALYGEPDWQRKAGRIEARIAERFWPAHDEGHAWEGNAADGNATAGTATAGTAEREGARPRRYPIASFTPLVTRDVFDLSACALLGAARVAPALGDPALAYPDEAFVARGVLPPAFAPTIEKGDPEWPALRRYHLYAFRNRPHEYHNGGVWPIWLGWLALAYTRTGEADRLARLRTLVAARLDEHPAYNFEEFLHGRTSVPGGTPRMAYSATGLVLLALADQPAAEELLA